MAFSEGRARWAWVLGGAMVMVLALGLRDWGRVRERAAAGTPAIEAWETDPERWGRVHPREYHSWRSGREPSPVDIGYGPGRTRWGRAARGMRGPAQLYAGFSLAASGSAQPPEPRAHPIGCQACHDPATLGLRVSQPAFLEALSRRGVDAAQLTHQELKSYVCAQCHAARFRSTLGGEPELPFTAEGIHATADGGRQADWEHAGSGTPLLRVRHPEFELWSLGGHARRGVACADCHMPYRAEGSVRVSDHGLQSPLLDGSAACGRCHHWSGQDFQVRVEAIQDATRLLQERAAVALVEAHAAAARAMKVGVAEEDLTRVRALLRSAQTRWDFIASESSTGFHAPQAAAEVLGVAIDLARQAELLAAEAAAKKRGKG